MTTIDWTRPVYLHNRRRPLKPVTICGRGDRPFHAFLDEEYPDRGHIYYNDDGTPFKGAPPISNTPGFDATQMPLGWMRLHWYDPKGVAMHEDFPCLNDALNRATILYMKDEGTLVALDNWLGEQACPPDQLLPIAKIRAKEALEAYDHEKMQTNPAWGAF